MTDMGFRRLVVAVDASSEGPDTLDAAARLAASLRAELHSLFVEDVNMLHMAALPFTRVAGHGPVSDTVEPAMVERLFRRQSAAARAALEAVAAEQPLDWTYRVVRGAPAPEVVTSANAESCDLLIVQHRGLAAAVQAAIGGCRASVMCFEAASRHARNVVAFSPAARIDLDFLRRVAAFAKAADRHLTVLRPDRTVTAQTDIDAVFDELALPRDTRPVGAATSLRDAARAHTNAILAVHAKSLEDRDLATQLADLPDRPNCSVLIVR